MSLEVGIGDKGWALDTKDSQTIRKNLDVDGNRCLIDRFDDLFQKIISDLRIFWCPEYF